MKNIIIIFFLFCETLLLSSCVGTEKTEVTNNEPIPKDKIEVVSSSGTLNLSQTKAYPGATIGINANFNKEIKSVNVSFDNTLRPQVKEPQGKTWSGTFEIPKENIQFGFHKLEVVAKPKDNTPSMTLETKLEIIKPPKIEIAYSRTNPGKQLIEVKSSGKLTKVLLIAPSGEKIPLIPDTGNTRYTIEYQLPNPKQGTAKLLIDDENNLSLEHNLYVDDPTRQRLYSEFGTVYSINLDFTDQAVFTEIKNPIIKDSMIEEIASQAEEGSLEIHVNSKEVKSISPDKKWIFYNISKAFKMSDKYVYAGRKVWGIHCKWNCLYNIEKQETVFIGKPHIIFRFVTATENATIEIGPTYYPLNWDKDNLYMVEQIKDDKIFYGSQMKFYESLAETDYYGLPETRDAKSKYISMSLNDYSITSLDNIFPPKPWVLFRSESAGIAEYADYSGKQNNILSDLSGSKQWTESYVKSQMNKEVIYNNEPYILDDIEPRACSIVKDSRYVLYYNTYVRKRKNPPMAEDYNSVYRIFYIAILDFETGKVTTQIDLKDSDNDREDNYHINIPIDVDVTTDNDYPVYLFNHVDEKDKNKTVYQFAKIIDNKVIMEGNTVRNIEGRDKRYFIR